MQVTISAYAGWHGVQLAGELAKRGHLRKFASLVRPGVLPPIQRPYAAYPYAVALPVAIQRRLERYFPFRFPERFSAFMCQSYDQWSRRLIDDQTDLAVAWLPFSKEFLTEARRRKIPTVVDLGSCHYSTVDRLMQEEFALAGHSYPTGTVDERCESQLALADFMVVASEFARRSYIEAGIDGARVLKVPYGVDPDMFRPGVKDDDVFRIMFAGGVSLRKGVRYLLQAFSELSLPHAELVLIGDPEREMLPFIKKYSRNTIRIIPSVPPGREIAAWYQRSSLFVLPSIEEGLARVQLEAMASGLPVIATPNTGGEELIEEGVQGYLVPIRDVGKLKERIAHLYENKEIRQLMGQRARAKIKAGFTWEHYGERMIAEYEKILDSARATSGLLKNKDLDQV